MVTVNEITESGYNVCLLLDNGEKVWLKKKDLLVFPVSEGDEWDEEEFRKSVSLFQYPRALNLAVGMLARRPCSTGEIRKRLSEKLYMQEVISLVLYKLEKENLLNDKDFCEQWIRYRLDCKYGPRRIIQELKYKGIPAEMAETMLDAMDQEKLSESQAVLFASKSWQKWKCDGDRKKTRQKIIMQLVRRGYSWDTAKQASDIAENQLDE